MFGKLKYKMILVLCLAAMMLTGCDKRTADYVEIHNKSNTVFDDVGILLKDGYFYESHEKFTVDESTLGITIYFSNESEAGWE